MPNDLSNVRLADRIASLIDEDDTPAISSSSEAIVVRTPSGDTHPLTVPPGETLKVSEVLTRLNLTIAASAEFWVNGAKVPSDYNVSPGASITIVGGTVKGG